MKLFKTIQKIDNENVSLNILNLPILNQNLKDPLLQKLIRNLIIEIMSWMTEYENEERKRKQQQGVAIAKRKGLYKGRPVKFTSNHPSIKHAMYLRQNTNKTVKEICEITAISESTFYRCWKLFK